MNDEMKLQQKRFMGYNLVAFTIIFTVFGFILYAQISSALYTPVESAMIRSKNIVLESNDFLEHQLSFQNDDQSAAIRGRSDKPSGQFNMPIRVQTIVRDPSGNILNERSLGRLYFENYLDKIPLIEQENQGKITTFILAESTYRLLDFTKEMPDGEIYYIQLISSIDAEKAIVDNFVRFLVICIVVFILLSIAASYYLSKKTMKPLVKSWKRQSEFVENASHELRTPLTVIQNKLETMLTKPEATIMQKAGEIGTALAETRRLTKLTADLMTLARADSNEIQLKKTSFSLDELIANVSEPYKEFAYIQGKIMRLELDLYPQIIADKNRIHQLMVILLDNALKYTAQGDSIFLRTYQKDGCAVLEVADTGIGIAEQSLAQVFNRFYREDKARSRETGGSGLGLSIAKWIVDSHGGNIYVEQNAGGGTMFRVKLNI